MVTGEPLQRGFSGECRKTCPKHDFRCLADGRLDMVAGECPWRRVCSGTL
jgi:hypothetical protein